MKNSRTVSVLKRWLWIVLFLIAWGWNETTVGQEKRDNEWEDESDGLGFADISEEKSKDEDEVEDKSKSSRWSLDGFTRSDWGLWVERFEKGENPFAKGRQNLDLALGYKSEILRFRASGHAEYDVAYLYKRDSYNEPTLDAYEWLVDLRETFMAASFDFFDITVGWQTVVWGEADVLSLVDVASPKDLREPGLADLADLRLPVLSTRLGLFSGYHRIETMIIHEAFFGYRSPPFGPFSPLPALLMEAPPDAESAAEYILNYPIWYEDEQVRFSINNQQYLMRWAYKGPGIDLALYLASVLDQQGVIRSDFVEIYAGILEENDANILLDHQRYMMVGHSGAWPFGNWLFKWELNAEIDRKFNENIEEPKRHSHI